MSKVIDATESISTSFVGKYSPVNEVKRKGFSFSLSRYAPERGEERWANYANRAARRPAYDIVYCWYVSEVVCLLPGMLLVDSDGDFIRETVRKPKMLQRQRGLDLSIDGCKSLYGGKEDVKFHPRYFSSAESAVFFLAPAIYNNYYHWLVECIPLLTLYRKFCYGVEIIIPEVKYKFQRDTLGYFLREEEKVVEIKDNKFVSRGFFSSPASQGNTLISPMVRDFYEEYRGVSGSRCVYVTREDASTRRILNEKELLGKLEELGFEKVSLGSMTFSDQVDIFSESLMVVAPHGAGLANTVFMPAGSSVVELIPETFDAGATSFFALSELFELNYHACLGVRGSDSGGPRNCDFYVDVDDVVLNVKNLLS